jgi:nitrogen-specific signal transduction histidine kinase
VSAPDLHAALAAESHEMSETLARFASISEGLVDSYQALAERADSIQQELDAKLVELAEVSGRLEAVLEALPSGVVVRDAEGRCERVNAAAPRLLRCAPEEVAGWLSDRLDDSAVDEGRSVRLDCEGEGGRRVLSWRSAQVHGAGGRPAGSVEVFDDHTELERLGAKLSQLDKMAALGTLSAGLAHELRNPLNAVRGFAALLRRELPEGSKARTWSERIVSGSDELEGIIEGLLRFARPGEVAQERLEASELIDSALEVARREHPQPELFEFDTDVALEPFAGDRVKLRQALRNLIANAMQVQPGGGRLRLFANREGDELCLGVDDAGPGVPEEQRGRVAEPFFTTRAEGTGLGLALVHTIARLHGGELQVGSAPQPYGGARFELRLPAQVAA